MIPTLPNENDYPNSPLGHQKLNVFAQTNAGTYIGVWLCECSQMFTAQTPDTVSGQQNIYNQYQTHIQGVT